MKEIPLTKGQVAIVDDEDFAGLSLHCWYAMWSSKTRSYYASRKRIIDGKQKTILMHREICGLGFGRVLQVDHRNHYTLDNRRSNLRICTALENHWNVGLRKTNRSGHQNVYWSQRRQRWIFRMRINYNRIQCSFVSKDEAIREARRLLVERRGNYAFDGLRQEAI